MRRVCKLTEKERCDLQQVIEDISFTCRCKIYRFLGVSMKFTRENCPVASPLRSYTILLSILIYCADEVDSVPKESNHSVMLAKASQRSRKYSFVFIVVCCV